jgi:branched-chain amino acid transport system ATP-binding protein/sulfate-transporting ATPase
MAAMMSRLNHLLEARGLTRTFGGVVALDHLDLAVEPNEILGLIGPNGSGKTTFFNVATGIYGADAGTSPSMAPRSRELRRAPFITPDFPHFPALTPFAAAVDLRQHHDRQPQAAQSGPVVQPDQRVAPSSASSRRTIARRARSLKCSSRSSPVGCSSRCRPADDRPAPNRNLPRPDQPAKAAAARRAVGGMTHEETTELMDDILQIRSLNKNLAIVIVEHEMGVIERITDRCVVLNFGRKIAEGPYRQVAADRQVQEAYLGVA